MRLENEENERMVHVADDVVIRAELNEVFGYCWKAKLWPKLTEHVKRIEMLDEQEGLQRFRMTVDNNGKLYTVETVRRATGREQIDYQQTTPPAFLRRHTGRWCFRREGNAVHVSLTHEAEVDESRALALLPVKNLDEAEHFVAESLSKNGRRTMLAIKAHLES